MKLKFSLDTPLTDTMVFEKIYPDELQVDLEYKQELKDNGAEFIILLDEETGSFIGETYFIPLDNLKDEEPDELQLEDGLEPYYGTNLVYCYSTTILPKYQNLGYGKILKSFLYGYLQAKGYRGSIAHAKEGASVKLNTFFGAEIIGDFDNWFQTGIKHFMYLKIF